MVVQTALGSISRDRQTRSGWGGSGGIGLRPHPIIDMSTELTPHLWLLKATGVLHRVTESEHRFSGSITVNKSTMLAAADELQAATRDAMAWVTANPCPDPNLSDHMARMLSACAEVALNAQRAATDPFGETDKAMGHVGDLLALIDFHLRTLNDW